MSRKSSGNISPEENIEGTSARTRPLSYEEIMQKRSKKVAVEPNNTNADVKEPAQNGGDKRGLDEHSKHGMSSRNIRDLKHITKDHSKREDRKESTEEDNEKRKLIGRGRRDIGSLGEKHKESELENVGTKSDYIQEPIKKLRSTVVAKDKFKDGDDKSRAAEKRKNDTLYEDKRLLEHSMRRKHDNAERYEGSDYHVRYERWKDRSRPLYVDSRAKRRRSSSREHNRAWRERSLSLSPRVKRQYHYEHNYDDPPRYHAKDRPRKQYTSRLSIDDGYGAGSYRKREEKLGGYSPRKRIAEPVVKPPSPIIPSPDKKASTWDQRPSGGNQNDGGNASNASLSAAAKITSSLSTHIISKIESAAALETALLGKTEAIDSVQLTQATRPMRRLYVENLPASASEKGVMDCLNDFFLSSGVNHIEGTKPCLNCIIYSEKHQALVEFLTPEDATSALSFDGRSFSGSVLKIRRPKDYVEITPAVPLEKAEEKPKTVSSEVMDSSHKLFIAGIPEILSQEMIMEILTAFGPLASFRLEHKDEIDGPCAFLEYADHSTTQKACAGLNGMKFGGSVLSVVQALPDAPEKGYTNSRPSYAVPLHVKALIARPTKVLQLKNVLAPEDISLLPKQELDEVLEDVRIECARFGAVKSVNLVNVAPVSGGMGEAVLQESDNLQYTIKPAAKCAHPVLKEEGSVLWGIKESYEVEDLPNNPHEVRFQELITEESSRSPMLDGPIADHSGEQKLDLILKAEAKEIVLEKGTMLAEGDESNHCVDEGGSSSLERISTRTDPGHVTETVKSEGAMQDTGVQNPDAEGEATGIAQQTDQTKNDLVAYADLLEPGSVLVEYVREEATCIAAHALQGRCYGKHIVSVNYVPHDVYLMKFPRR